MKITLILLSVGQFLLLLQVDNTNGKYTAETADYVLEAKSECHYMNGTQKVRFLQRHFYNQEEIVYFDSDVGYFIPKTEFGRPDAEYWNKDKDFIEQQKGEVQRYCIYNYGVSENVGITGRRVQPTVQIYLMPEYEDPQTNHHMLMCSAYGFYPSEIEVKWFRNGQEEIGQVESTEPYQNGDWTFQIMVMLETEIQKGDLFTCEVQHKSLEAPIRIDWKPHRSDSATSKVATGIVGILLGLVFIIAGVVVCLRGRKAQMLFRGSQAERFLHS